MIFNEPSYIDSTTQDHWYRLATTLSYRARRVGQLRLDLPKRANPGWTVRELLYFATLQNEDLCDAVLVVLLKYGMHDSMVCAATPLTGRRIMRLLYDWRDVEPHVHLNPAKVRDVIAKMAESGNVFRARVRYAKYRAQSTDRQKLDR